MSTYEARREDYDGEATSIKWATVAWLVGLSVLTGMAVYASTRAIATYRAIVLLREQRSWHVGGPSPQLTPEMVVRRQLASLRDDPAPVQGMADCFAFASPLNREETGPLERFAQLVRRPPYDALRHPVETLVGKTLQVARYARVLVTVVDDEAQSRIFRFELSLQREPPFTDCWMTDSVLEVDPHELEEHPDGETAPPMTVTSTASYRTE